MSHDGVVGVDPLHVTLGAGDAVLDDAFEHSRLTNVTLVVAGVRHQTSRSRVANYKRENGKKKNTMKERKLIGIRTHTHTHTKRKKNQTHSLFHAYIILRRSEPGY